MNPYLEINNSSNDQEVFNPQRPFECKMRQKPLGQCHPYFDILSYLVA